MWRRSYVERDEPAKRKFENKREREDNWLKSIPKKSYWEAGLQMEELASSLDTGTFRLVQIKQHGQTREWCVTIQTWILFLLSRRQGDWFTERWAKEWWSRDLEESSRSLDSLLKEMKTEANNVLSKDHPSNHHNTVGTHNEVSFKIFSLKRVQGPFLALLLSLDTLSVTHHQEAGSGDLYRLPLRREGAYLFLVPMTRVLLFKQQCKPI